MPRERYDGDRDRPARRSKSNTTIIVVLAVVGVLVAVPCLAVGFFAVMWSQVESDKTRRPAGAGQDYVAMTVDQLVDEWKANPAAAAEEYKRTGVVLTGTLRVIDSNIHDQVYIDVRGDDEANARTHIFVVSGPALDQLKWVKVGDRVQVTARAEGSVNATPWLKAEDIRPAR